MANPRLKYFPIVQDFNYYCWKEIDKIFLEHLSILEKSDTTDGSRSGIGRVAGSLPSMIPIAGDVITCAITEIGNYGLRKWYKIKARSVKDIVYLMRDDEHKTYFRNILMKAIYAIACSYSEQIKKYCADSTALGAQRLGYDAAHRIIDALQNGHLVEINEEFIIRSIVFKPTDLLNEIGNKFKDRGAAWNPKRSEIEEMYRKAGLYHNKQFYKNQNTDAEQHRYRFKFYFESSDIIEKEWQMEKTHQGVQEQLISLDDFEEDYPKILKYVIQQYPEEAAMLDRQIKSDELKKEMKDLENLANVDRQMKYDEVVQCVQQSLLDLGRTLKRKQEFMEKLAFRKQARGRLSTI